MLGKLQLTFSVEAEPRTGKATGTALKIYLNQRRVSQFFPSFLNSCCFYGLRISNKEYILAPLLRNALFLSNFLFQFSFLPLTYENNTHCQSYHFD